MFTTILAFLPAFTIIVLVHEFGHFLAARLCGVKVYEFSFGFPFSPRLITFYRSKETEFTVRLLPIGGFVSFSKDGDQNSIDLFNVSHFKRAVIITAGSLFNIAFAFFLFNLAYMIAKDISLIESLLMSLKIVFQIISGTINLIANIVSGNNSSGDIVGPVGIASLAGQAISKGFFNFIFFIANLSMSLGILNLLPMPALDGGQLMIIFTETISRRKVNLKVHQVFNLAGLILFAALTVFVTYKDIIRILG